MIRATARFLPALLPLAMAACSTTGDYPSLNQRDFERIGGRVEPVAAEAQPEAPKLPPASADLVTRLDGLLSAAREADRQFKAQQDTAESAVARANGAAATSDPWASAHIALGKLETSRSAAVAALAELDGLYADARDKAPLEPSPSALAIADARSQVSALVEAQDREIAALAARL
jgi:hypothetical protein